MRCKNLELLTRANGEVKLSVTLLDKTAVNVLQELTEVDILELTLKKYRKKRSLTANGAMWLLLDKLADKLETTKDELYLHFLEQYGTFTHMIIKPDAVEKFKQEWRATREIGEVTINGQVGVQLQCYFGSSTMNSKEFSRLLQGILNECESQGIEGLTDKEFQRLIEGVE